MPLIDGTMTERPRPIAFKFKEQLSLSDNRYKLYSSDKGGTYALYDIVADPSESQDIVEDHSEVAASMREALTAMGRFARCELAVGPVGS